MSEENMQKNEEQRDEKLSELEKKSEEYLNGWKRERADFLNYKKDEMERISQLVSYANTEIILNLLPIFDNVARAEKEIPETMKNDTWTEGFLQIHNQIKDFLKQGGIEEIVVIGKPFDPETMEAVEEVEEEGQSGTVVEELQKGYMMHGKILRPAKVKVKK